MEPDILSDSEDEPFELEEEDDFSTIFDELKSQWQLTEINHCVSKTASEIFWRTALKYFPKLHGAKGKKKTLQFKTIRRKMYDEKVPAVTMEIGYRNRDTGEIKIVKDSITQVKNFPPDKFDKLFEIGTVEVSYINDVEMLPFNILQQPDR